MIYIGFDKGTAYSWILFAFCTWGCAWLALFKIALDEVKTMFISLNWTEFHRFSIGWKKRMNWKNNRQGVLSPETTRLYIQLTQITRRVVCWSVIRLTTTNLHNPKHSFANHCSMLHKRLSSKINIPSHWVLTYQLGSRCSCYCVWRKPHLETLNP